jgi:hypothetical protein
VLGRRAAALSPAVATQDCILLPVELATGAAITAFLQRIRHRIVFSRLLPLQHPQRW